MTKGPLAASPVPYERVFAPFACALLVGCGLLAASHGAPAGFDPDRPTAETASAHSAQYAPSASWSAAPALRAPDSDNDGENDDDDDVLGGDAAITTDVDQPAMFDVSVSIDRRAPSWTSRTTDGHSLRGPPASNQDSTDLELAGNDNDDDDLTAVATTATTLSLTSHSSAFAGTPPARSSHSLGRAQRAPPISSL